MLIKLMMGALQFKNIAYLKMQDLFKHLSNGQNPETLFITCIDSRLNPNLITEALPGELLFIRNPGNIIPPFPSLFSEAATIEYAFKKLDIKDIIICGHSQCGAMQALLTPGIENELPAVSTWVKHSYLVVDQMKSTSVMSSAEQLSFATKQNILVQIEHLKTYPLIASKLEAKQLTIHAWIYDIKSGEVHIYDSEKKDFFSVEVVLNLAITKIVMDYLEKLTHPKSLIEYQLLMQLFNTLLTNVQVIGDFIKEATRQNLWEEVEELSVDPLQNRLKPVVEAGLEIALPDLKKFQKNISQSDGYRQFCSQTLRHSFFSKLKPSEALISSPSNSMTRRIS